MQFLVCATSGYFADDVSAQCATCAAPIVHRPHGNPHAVKICAACADRMISAGAEVTVTEETHRELELYYGQQYTRRGRPRLSLWLLLLCSALFLAFAHKFLAGSNDLFKVSVHPFSQSSTLSRHQRSGLTESLDARLAHRVQVVNATDHAGREIVFTADDLRDRLWKRTGSDWRYLPEVARSDGLLGKRDGGVGADKVFDPNDGQLERRVVPDLEIESPIPTARLSTVADRVQFAPELASVEPLSVLKLEMAFSLFNAGTHGAGLFGRRAQRERRNEGSDSSESSQYPVRPDRWPVHIVALCRFIGGFASFGLGLLLTYRSDLGRNRLQLFCGVICIVAGSIALIALPWPR